MTRFSPMTLAIITLTLPSATHAEVTKTTKPNDKPADYDQKKQVKNIVVKSNDIFDLSDPETFFIHRWANYLHINTRDNVIRDKLSFKENDGVSQKDLEEVQRILRAEPYIRDAKVSFAKPAPDADIATDKD